MGMWFKTSQFPGCFSIKKHGDNNARNLDVDYERSHGEIGVTGCCACMVPFSREDAEDIEGLTEKAMNNVDSDFTIITFGLRQVMVINALGNPERIMHGLSPEKYQPYKIRLFKTIAMIGVYHAIVITIPMGIVGALLYEDFSDLIFLCINILSFVLSICISISYGFQYVMLDTMAAMDSILIKAKYSRKSSKQIIQFCDQRIGKISVMSQKMDTFCDLLHRKTQEEDKRTNANDFGDIAAFIGPIEAFICEDKPMFIAKINLLQYIL